MKRRALDRNGEPEETYICVVNVNSVLLAQAGSASTTDLHENACLRAWEGTRVRPHVVDFDTFSPKGVRPTCKESFIAGYLRTILLNY